MTAAPTIRTASPGDLDAIVAIEAACFARPWTRDIFEQELTRTIARVDVLVDDAAIDLISGSSDVVGFACTWHIADEAHLLRIAIASPLRRRGHAARLLAHLLARAAAEGCAHIDLEVAADNAAALALYLARGFVQVGRRPGYYATPPGDALLLRALLPRP